ncbi:MAG: YebC/PmpR family DNA-binding transcriptional regulator [Flavobacteriales bacterium]
MSGHSKWANIKHRKGAQDARRSKIFTKLIKELTVASKEGGTDPESNPRLRLAIQNAKGANMPKDTIDKAIKKGQGGDADNYQEVTYEGYAPNGVPIFIEATTDNINRTVSNVRAIFTKYGGSLGKNGSLEFLFDRKGVFTIQAGELDEDELTLELIDGGAEEVEREDDVFVVYASFEDFGNMQRKLEEMHIEPISAEVQRIAKNTTTLKVEASKKVLKMIDAFEDDDDVQKVFHNLELTDELMAALEAEA